MKRDFYKEAIDDIQRILHRTKIIEEFYVSLDIVPVVRCKECKWRDKEDVHSDGRKRCEMLCNIRFEPDFFCKYGEKE